MRASRFWLASLFIFFAGLVWLRPAVRAQEVTEAAVDPSLLEATTKEFFATVEKYRDDEQKFVISRETYFQLNTLAAQDEAIRRGKDFLLSRSELLSTYFTYLHLFLQQTRGVEVGDKTRVLNEIAENLAELAVYKDRIPSLYTRDDVHRHLTQFNQSQRQYLTAAYGALEVIKIGELQTVIDTASVLRQDMEGWVNAANLSAADRAIKLRGLQETDRLLQQARNDLAEILATQRKTAGSFVSADSYRTFQTKVDPIYIQIRQAESFLKEIVKGL